MGIMTRIHNKSNNKEREGKEGGIKRKGDRVTYWSEMLNVH